MKPLVFFLLMLLVGCSQKRKNEVTDSSLNSSIDVLLLKSSSANLTDSIRLISVDKAYNYLLKTNNTKFKRDNLIKVVDLYYKLYENDKLKKSATDLLKLSLEAKDTLTLGKAFNYIGKNKLDESQLDSAYYYFIKAEKIFITKKDNTSLIDNYIRKAGIEFQIGDFYSSEISSVKSLNYNNSNIVTKYDAFNLIGASSAENHNYENAITYHNKAIELVKNNPIVDSEVKLAKSYNNIGFVYQNLNIHKKAMTFFKLGLDQKEIFNKKPDLYLMLLDNYAYSKFKTNDVKELPNLFYDALKQREKLNINRGIIASKFHLSEYYLYSKDTLKAKKFAVESLQLAKKIQEFDVLAQLKLLSNVDVKNAAKYSKQYIKLNDSLQMAQNKDKERFARIAYETDEVIKENVNLGRINQNLIYYIIGFGVLAVIGGLLVVIFRQRSKQNKLLFLQSQQEANENIYQLLLAQQAKVAEVRQSEKSHIALELHDGIMNKLASTRLNLFVLSKKTDPDTIAKCLTHIANIQTIETEIRNVAHDLNQEVFSEKNSFKLLLTDFIADQNVHQTTQYELETDEKINWENINNPIKINLFRILQEAASNCNKYAKATQAVIAFVLDENQLCMSVVDNGVGTNLLATKNGIGVQNMKQRIKLLGGVISIVSEPEKGTKINLAVPLAKS